MDCAIPSAETETAVLFPLVVSLGFAALGFMVILIHRYGIVALFSPRHTLKFDHPYMKYVAVPCTLVTFYLFLGSSFADELAEHVCGIVAEPSLYPTAFLLSWLSLGGAGALLGLQSRLASRTRLWAGLKLTTITVCGTALSFDLAALGAPLFLQVWIPVAWGLVSSYLTSKRRPPQKTAHGDTE